MPSKMSLFNKELILQIGRSTGWISIVYFLGLLFLLPIRILMLYSDENKTSYEGKEGLFQFSFDFQIGLMVIVPVVLAVILFRFLHIKQSTDLMHSLPIKRDKIFNYYTITGMCFLVVPVAVISIILMIMHATLDLSNMFSTIDIFYWTGTTIVIILLLYTAGVFIAMMTGISAVQAVLAYVFLLFPIGFTLLLFYNFKLLLYGFPSDYFLSGQLNRLSPISYATVLNRRMFHWTDAIIYMIFILVFYGLALFFYKKRKLEAASEAIAFSKLRAVFKYGATFCFMLFGGTYFSQGPYSSDGWTVFGYAVGAVFGYFLAEMVLRKTWRVFRNFKGLIVYSAIIALVIVGVDTLGIYESKVPEENQIKNVLLTDNPNIYLNQVDFYGGYINPPVPMKEKMNLEEVRKLHQQILKNKTINLQRINDNTKNVFLMYELKNGHHVTREYRVNERLYSDFFKAIYESKEYKLTAKEIFNIKESKIKTINVMANGPINKMVSITDPKEKQEAISALSADVLAESYEDSIYYRPKESIEFKIDDNYSFYLDFKPTYKNFTEWLKEKNLTDRAKVTADDISHVLITKVDSSHTENPEKIKRDIENSGNSLDVTDKEKIELLLNNAGTDYRSEYKAIAYYNVGNFSDVLFFDEEHVPEFMKKELK